ncbi:MAG: hypothetical protein HC803_01740 [Saprospiraceae bacterium]|nr:hypothetical protein [Saprospiraceae bacterium]
MKSFKHWIRQEVEEIFGVKEVRKHPLLEKWLGAEFDISDKEKERLEELRLLLDENVDLWNEAIPIAIGKNEFFRSTFAARQLQYSTLSNVYGTSFSR